MARDCGTSNNGNEQIKNVGIVNSEKLSSLHQDIARSNQKSSVQTIKEVEQAIQIKFNEPFLENGPDL